MHPPSRFASLKGAHPADAGASTASAKDAEINTEKDGDAKQTRPTVAQRFNVNYS